MRAVISSAVCAALLFSALPAGAADSYKFSLFNKTTKYTISGFQTFEKGKWDSWTGVSLAPGETAAMDWNSNEGACTVPFRIIYAEIQTEQYQVNWCQVKNIYVTDTDVTYD